MVKRPLWTLAVVFLVACLCSTMLAQQSAVSGNVNGSVTDSTGAVISGATVTLTGPTGNKTTQTNDQGVFFFPSLSPGTYSIKVERQGFKAADIRGVEVAINRNSSVHIGMQPGSASEVVNVSAEAVTVDTASTAVGTNLSDNFYANVPVQRNVAGLFYAAPGVSDGGGTGAANPSISGGSGLENLYVADGVDITDTSFGGLGTYNRNFGSVGTGINLSFIKEVQVKTGGYEPQYGKSTGGIVQIVTKSGSNEFHGAIAGYFAPQQLEATRVQPDDTNRLNVFGYRYHQEGFDASGELGGYVPGLKNRLFFFGSINPTWNNTYDQAGRPFPLFNAGILKLRTNSFNYSAKGTLRLTDQHQLEASIFGDPSHTNTSAFRPIQFFNELNESGFSKLEYGSRNFVTRYNGTMSPTWLLNASFSMMHNKFFENYANTFNGLPNYQISSQLETAGLPGMRGNYVMQGVGFAENTESNNFGFDINTSKVVRAGGEHTFSIGYKMEKPEYNPFKERSGGLSPIPATNTLGGSYGADAVAGQLTDYQFQLRLAPDPFYATQAGNPVLAPLLGNECTLCPWMVVPGLSGPGPGGAVRVYLRNNRGEFGPHSIHTTGLYHAAFVNDAWTLNKYVTLNAGLRWEQQKLNGDTASYTFTDNWSPRFGVSVDPVGDRKSKIYANFGRYNYAIPLDMAERSLSNELDFQQARFAPDFTVDAGGNRIVNMTPWGSVIPIPDAAHVLNRANTAAANFDANGVCINPAGCGTGGAPFISFNSTTSILPGTRMQYLDEFVVGAERELWGGVVVSARYLDRRLKRIVEDVSGVPPEAAVTGLNQVYAITNPGPNTDAFTNPVEHIYPIGGAVPATCTDPNLTGDVTDSSGNTLGSVCFEPTPNVGNAVADGIPDGFPAPARIYRAVEIEANKAFSKNWMMRANWRISSLRGNYEGAFRNDNGQSDPSISSLYDFTAGQYGLLGDQFAIGPLNTDRTQVVNGFFSYIFDRTALKGLTLGTGINVQTGIPLSRYLSHPAYLNPGEIPVGGRGSLGRSPLTGSVDMHAEYGRSITEKTRLRVGADLFNIANSRRQLILDQNADVTFGTPNLDFLKGYQNARSIAGYQRPFNARFSVKFEF
jgi:hypothetical protein